MKHEFINFLSVTFPGFYDSILYDSDTLYYLGKNEGEGKEYDIKDWNGFTKSVCEDVVNLWNNAVDNSIIKSFKFKTLKSPAYYNFETDKIVADVELDYDELHDYLVNNSEAFQDYLTTYYKSRDGFISFIEHDINEFMEMFEMIEMADNKPYLNYLDVAIEFYLMRCLNIDDDDNESEYWYDLSDIGSDRLYEYTEEIKEEGEE